LKLENSIGARVSPGILLVGKRRTSYLVTVKDNKERKNEKTI